MTAALLLVDHWWVRTGIRLSAMDPAAAQYLPPADAVFLAAVLAGACGSAWQRRSVLGFPRRPLLGLPFAVIGAAIGASAARPPAAQAQHAPATIEP